MRRRHVFQVKQLNLVGRCVHLAGEKVRVGRNLDAGLEQPFSHFLVVRHHREHAGVGLPFVAATGAAIEGRLVGVVVRRAAVRAEQDEPRKVHRQSHHAQGRVDREDLFLDGEPHARDPLLVPGGRAGIEVVIAAQRLDEGVQRLRREPRAVRCLKQRGAQVFLTVEGSLP